MAWFLPGPIALALVASLRRRVLELEREVMELRIAPAPAPVELPPAPARPVVPDAPVAEPEAAPEPAPAPAPVPAPLPAPLPPPLPPRTPITPERIAVVLAAVLGGSFLVVGGLLFLLAAIERGWIGPTTRIALSSGTGLALTVVSGQVRRRQPVVGSVLTGVGLGIWYGAVYAASAFYALLPSPAASAGMVAITVVAAVSATRHRDRYGAVLALLGGMLAPLLIGSESPSAYTFIAYLAVLAAGFATVAIVRRWPELLFATALAVAVLHVAWSTTNYHVDIGPIALVGVLAVTLPFAVAARSEDPLVAGAGRLITAALPLIAIPWLHPGPAWFTDPRTGLLVVRPLPAGAAWAALAAAVLPAPLLVSGRQREDVAVASLLAAVTVGVFVVGWSDVPEPPLAALGLAPLALLVVAVATLARRELAMWGAALPAIAAFATVGVAVGGPGPYLLAVPLVAAGGLVAARFALGALSLPGLLAGVTVALLAAVDRVDEAPLWLAGCALGVLAALGPPPVRLRWPSVPLAAHLVAALAAPAVFLPLYWAWQEASGPDWIGLLPLLLALVPVTGAALLVRRGAPAADTALAVFVVVAIAGLTTALPLQLESQWLTVAWALEVLGLALAARRLTSPVVRGSAILLAAVVVTRLVLNPEALSYGDTGGPPVLNWTLYTWGVPFLALLLAVRAWPVRGPTDRAAQAGLAFGAIAVGFALINVEVSYTFQRSGSLALIGESVWQEMVRSVAWGLYGLAVLVWGWIADRRPVRFVGFAFVLLAAVKVCVFDLWSLAGFVRVGAVLGLGVVLILAALVFERLVLRTTKDREGAS